MRMLILSVIVLLLMQVPAFSQSGFTIQADNGIISDVKETNGSYIIEIKIVLPDRDFQKLHIYINRKLELSFECDGNPNCTGLSSQDIQKGQILLRFKGKKLESISGRTIFYKDSVLSDTSSNNISFSGNGSMRRDYLFMSALKSETKDKKGSFATLIVCEKKENDGKSIGGLPGLTFLCPDSVYNKDCFCGIPVKNAFENMYLPPCFDKNGKAVSVSYHVLYDMSQTDPMRKMFLFKTKKGNLVTSKCKNPPYPSYEFASIRKRLRIRVGDIIAVSAIAHKDSAIVIDSNSVNFFLDSAHVAQGSFTDAGNNTLPAGKASAFSKGSDSLLKGAVTLNGDLVYFNNYFRGGNFIQSIYLQQLSCLQHNIARFFQLQVIPKSGRELAEALDERIADGSNNQPYYSFACRLLTQLIAEYDEALKHISNYRVYTQPMQVPNADELTVGIGTKTNQNIAYLYRHNFLVRGGLKLDFSTGVFMTNLYSRDFSIRSTRLTFRDSLNGSTRDTTGNTIGENSKKMNVNTGFMVHFYSRSGHYWNMGGVAGVTFNNSQFMFLLGGAVMFRMGNARLSLVGGIAFGKEKELDINQQQYIYDEEKFPPGKIYNEDNRPGQVVLNDRLPRFFTEPNIVTYDKRKTSFFAGITYNFASIKL